MDFERARNFIYKNARPLDFARWKFLFENGSQEEVQSALVAYQNEDGGFGHALEPDCWNPNSSPVQTWVASRIINEINLEDKNHPLIQGILKYLASGVDFDGHTWLNSIESNNDHPHAPWWSYDPGAEFTYNPTASLIGFIMKFADRNSQLFALASILAKEAYAHFRSHHPLDQMHTVANYVELYEDLKTTLIADLIDMVEFKNMLHAQIQHVLTHDTSRWAVDYVCKPSLFIGSKSSDFYLANMYTCYYECDFIAKTQEPDGTWAVTWAWAEYPEEWHISKSWWKSNLIISNLKFLQAIGN